MKNLALFTLLGAVSARRGKCQSFVQTQADFDLSKYVGTWYEIQRDKSTTYEWFGQCIQAIYTANDDGTIAVENRGWYDYLQKYTSIYLTAKCQPGTALCHVSFKPDTDYTPNYEVLLTDYESYSVVYDCQQEGTDKESESMWILARTNTLDASLVESLKEKASALVPGYDWSHSEKTKQPNTCKYAGTKDSSENFLY